MSAMYAQMSEREPSNEHELGTKPFVERRLTRSATFKASTLWLLPALGLLPTCVGERGAGF